MKLTGKRLYYKKLNGKKLEKGLIVFTYSELNKKQKELYKKANVCGITTLVVSTIWGWSISSREKYNRYLAEIILDNFPYFDFNGKKFWFYNEQDINSNEWLIGFPPTMKNE